MPSWTTVESEMSQIGCPPLPSSHRAANCENAQKTFYMWEISPPNPRHNSVPITPERKFQNKRERGTRTRKQAKTIVLVKWALAHVKRVECFMYLDCWRTSSALGFLVKIRVLRYGTIMRWSSDAFRSSNMPGWCYCNHVQRRFCLRDICIVALIRWLSISGPIN